MEQQLFSLVVLIKR